MVKKISFIFMISVFALSLYGSKAEATTNYDGKIVKMNGLSSLYYVAADGKRYVFPSENTYKSWFTGYNSVVTLSQSDLTALPLGGNVLYRPGVLLIKITTDPKVYAVSKKGVLRWVTTEAIAKTLYGDNWNKLVDDVADSFFTNYQVGAAINSVSDFDPDNEASVVNNIDTNLNLSSTNALLAQTKKCQITNNARVCQASANTTTNTNTSNDTASPYITKITVTDGGTKGYVDANDKITITFNEAINPTSINSQLTAGGSVSSLSSNVNAAVSVSSDGLLTVSKIASFDLGKAESNGQSAVKISLDSSAKVLTITLLSGASIKIDDEDFGDAKQIGGTIKDQSGNIMKDDANIGKPDGTFGGVNTNDGIKPYITAIKVSNNGRDGYIDVGDQIQITFSEEIDGSSVNSGLNNDSSVSGVLASKTGGVTLSKSGILSVIHIASFYAGKVSDGGSFDVNLALNSTGRILTITLANGDSIGLTSENLEDTQQIGSTIEDTDGNRMDSDPNIKDPSGSFIGNSTSTGPGISLVKIYNEGYVGYIDEGDKIVVTFNSEIDGSNLSGNADPSETGGVKINSNGLLTVADILTFDIGEVAAAGEFETNLSLSSDKKVLTITLTDGDAVKIKSESFGKVAQLGGYILDASDDTAMKSQSNLDAPSGTFGGDSVSKPPYIAKIKVTNGNSAGHIDAGDKIEITFSEALDPTSINNSLKLNSYVTNIDNDNTGGVNIGRDGILIISDVAQFNVGDIGSKTEFKTKLALNSLGNVLTITLDTGTQVEISNQKLNNAEQIGGILKDGDDLSMLSDPSIDDPIGSF